MIDNIIVKWYNEGTKSRTAGTDRGGKKMWKLTFFVQVDGWKDGGYTNVHYFLTKSAALEWLAKPWNACVSLVSLSRVQNQGRREQTAEAKE